MSTEENKKLIRYLIDEALNKGNLDLADKYFTSDYVVHIPSNPNLPRGPGVFRQVIGMWRSAFPDWHMTIEELIAEGDKVANRFTTRGTHKAPLMGIPATGKQMTVRGMEIHRIADGKVAETWVCDDIPSIMQQLGIVAPPPISRGQGGPPQTH
jgi:steroid delta-isomerase-like uncharacterized protein